MTFQEKSFIARQLAVMLDAGLPLSQSVRSLSEQTDNPILRKTLAQVLRDLENGYKLSDAAKKHPKIFNNVFVSIVAAGEASGKLDVALGLLADEMERDAGFRGKVIGAMLYPGFIVVAMFVVGIIMVTRIVPALESVFKEANIDLPWTTITVVFITNSIISYWFIYIFVLVFGAYMMIRFLRTEDGKRSFNSFVMRVPALGKLFMNLEMARMTRILGIMMKAGVPIIQSLDAVALVMDSVIYKEILQIVARNVERGAPISQTMAKFEEIPKTVVQMIAAGEKTGKLEQVLGKLADFYEVETNQAIKNFSALIEPVIFVIVDSNSSKRCYI